MKKILCIIILFFFSFYCYSQGEHYVNYSLNDILWIKNQEALYKKSKSLFPLKYYKIAFHIVRTSAGTGGLDVSKIYKALGFMNEKYIGANVQFYICDISYIDNDTYYNFNRTYEESNLTRTYNIGDAINIYLFGNMTYMDDHSVEQNLWGISVLPPGASLIELRNETMDELTTITHEVGHSFGLPHTHNDYFPGVPNEYVDGSNCSTAGDFFCDTPADPKLHFEADVNEACVYCGGATDAHGDAYNPSTDLIMSYARHNCRTRFSLEQLGSINYWANQSCRTCYSHMYTLENTILSSNQTITEDVIILRNIKVENNSAIILQPCALVEISGDSEISLGSTLDIE